LPNYEIALPPGSKNIRIKTSTQEIPVDWYFTRDGKDGAEVIVPLFAGDEFVGEVLEGNWLKGDDGSIQGPFTAKLNGSGSLEITGRSNSGGTNRFGWISTKSKIPILDDLIIDIHVKLPSYTTSNYLYLKFLLSDDNSGRPGLDENWIECLIRAGTSAYKIQITKKVSGTATTLLSLTNVANNEGIFRIKFEENKSGHYHSHFYFHDGAGGIDESTDEVSGSPFSLNLAVDSMYAHLVFVSSETTNRTVSSDFVRVYYPG